MSGLTTQEELATSLEQSIREIHGLQVNNTSVADIIAISREIPENVTDLNAATAERLAGRFLKGMDICADLYTLAISYEMRMEAQKKAAFSKAMLVNAQEAGIKTAKDREQYAFSDEEYLQKNERCIEAKVFKTLLEEKKAVLNKAHHLMKNIVNNDAGHLAENPVAESKSEWVRSSQW